MENYALRRINVRAIIHLDGKILAVKHKNSAGDAAPYYAIPGGGLDPLESLIDGLTREIIEETGIRPEIGNLLFVQQFPSKRKDYDEELEFFFHVKNPQDYQSVDLAVTTHGHHELAICEFVDPRKVTILPEFLKTIDIEDYIASLRPTYLHGEL